MIDVAVNIFAKPFQTALSLLSLLERCGRHIGTIWLQFEPVGSKHDPITPYHIADWLREQLGDARIRVSQPEYWLDLNAADPQRLGDTAYRMGIRYQHAFENSTSDRLFLMHNDVFVLKDILGDMSDAMGDAFAIGQLGQCWNCPASNEELMRDVADHAPCTPATYENFQPDFDTLRELYAQGHARNVFVRPYDRAFVGEFDMQPWPLPECRINEWACLINLKAVQSHCIPRGPALSPGAYRQCGPVCLDIGVTWFRQMHALGMRARHFDVSHHMKHWVGTGKNTPRRYALAEDNALRLLQRHYPQWLAWLRGRTGKDFTR